MGFTEQAREERVEGGIPQTQSERSGPEPAGSSSGEEERDADPRGGPQEWERPGESAEGPEQELRAGAEVSRPADRVWGEEDLCQWPFTLTPCTTMASWRHLVETSIVDHTTPDFSVYSLAEILIVLAHRFPGRVGELYRTFDIGIRPCDVREYGKDVLPLPRPSLDIYRSLQQGRPSLSRSRRKNTRLQLSFGITLP
jgi:hypothetical protein